MLVDKGRKIERLESELSAALKESLTKSKALSASEEGFARLK